jgi:MFS family permease
MIEGGLQTFGVACGQLVGYGFYFVKGQAQWRVPVGVQLIPALIVFLCINFLPESPRWLIKHGLISDATHNLAKLRGLELDDPVLLEERDSIIASFESQAELEPFSYRELFQNGKTKTFYRVAIGLFIQSAQQLTGINMVSTYANKILQESFDLSPSLSHLVAAMGGLEYAFCSLVSVFLIEGLGRRRSFFWTAFGMGCCFCIIGGLTSTTDRTCQLVGAGFLFLFNTLFGLAWVGGPFLYSAEIAPLRCRSQANAIASGGNWLFCFVVVMIIPPAFATIGWKTVSIRTSRSFYEQVANFRMHLVHHLCDLQLLLLPHHLLLPCRDEEAISGRTGRHLCCRRQSSQARANDGTQHLNRRGKRSSWTGC